MNKKLTTSEKRVEERDVPLMVFDWDKALRIIIERREKHPDLRAEAGLQGDWNATKRLIYNATGPLISGEEGLLSTWAVPTLILTWNTNDQTEFECYIIGTKLLEKSYSQWTEDQVNILKNQG